MPRHWRAWTCWPPLAEQLLSNTRPATIDTTPWSPLGLYASPLCFHVVRSSIRGPPLIRASPRCQETKVSGLDRPPQVSSPRRPHARGARRSAHAPTIKTTGRARRQGSSDALSRRPRGPASPFPRTLSIRTTLGGRPSRGSGGRGSGSCPARGSKERRGRVKCRVGGYGGHARPGPV